MRPFANTIVQLRARLLTKTCFSKRLISFLHGINIENEHDMIRNYLTIALRGMMRDKAYTIINILGLSIGVACCLFLALYIQDETSYDRHHRDVDNVYLITSIMGENADKTMYTTSPPIAWGIKDELPEIETVARLVNPPGVGQNLIRYEDKQFYETDGLIADSTVFDILSYDFIAGNSKKALVEANSIVISETLARKIFGEESSLGKTISVNQGGNEVDMKITGVLAEKQKHSHMKANFFVSMTSSGWPEYIRGPGVADQWAGQNFMMSYIRLKPGSSQQDFISKMNKVFLKHGADDLKNLGIKKKLAIEPIKDIYLHARFGNRSPRITYLYVIGSIAAFILLIGCVNFMNLSTAKATKRANEVGLRKTLGAYRSSLITQFLGEAMVIVIVAITLSLGLVQLLLPVFNALTSKDISFESENLGFIFLALAALTVITGIIAGSYPALYLSSFQPVKVLKGKFAVSSSGSLMRKSLVVFQFVVAITLVCGMIIITKQLDFMQNKSLGFSSRNKIILPLRLEGVRANRETMQTELLKQSSIKDVTAVHYVPGSNIWHDFSLYPEGSSMDNAVNIKNTWVEPNYIEVMDIKLIAGRNFTNNRETESQNKIILNRTAVTRLGFQPDEIVGKIIYNDRGDVRSEFEVIGVIEDYHQTSVRDEIFPLLFRMPDEASEYNFMVVEAQTEQTTEVLTTLEEVWKKVNPQIPFEFSFLDENIAKQYDEDRRVSKIISSFTIIAMIISCLGLYGLSTYMAERRFKEIGVRKVMGASISQITQMMSGEFLKLVIIAFVIAVPLAWYGIEKWLENFAYKTPVSSMVFVAAGVSALLVALATVSFESIRAASGNPVKALRNE
jgi:putative ABC transport system permease protein